MSGEGHETAADISAEFRGAVAHPEFIEQIEEGVESVALERNRAEPAGDVRLIPARGAEGQRADGIRHIGVDLVLALDDIVVKEFVAKSQDVKINDRVH